MFNFKFLEKCLGIVFPSHFVYDFSKKSFSYVILINWPNLIVWLPLLREILDNMRIAIVCLPGCYVINFEINFIFLIKSFFQKSRKKFKYRENKKSFKEKWIAFFYHFQKSFQLPKFKGTLMQIWKSTYMFVFI